MISATPSGEVARFGGTGTSSNVVCPRLRGWLRAVLACAAMAACGDSSVSVGVPQDDPVLVASTLQIVSGDGQEGVVGEMLAEPLVVRVVTSDGTPLSGAPLSWEVLSGRGSPRGQGATRSTSFRTLTGADGTSTIEWELGTTSGTQEVWAEIALAPSLTSVEGVSQAPGNGNGLNNGKKVGFTANVRPGSLKNVEVTPDNPNIATGETLDFEALALDKWGNPLPGMSWQWRSTNQAVASVDGSGNVTGLSEGETEIVAETDGVSGSETLHVWTVLDTTTTGPADATIQLSGGDGQSGVVATQLSQPLSVRVLDGSGQPYPDVMLRWVFASGSGSSAEGSGQSFYVHTDAQGSSSVTWTLGTTAGAQAAYAEIVVAEDGSGTTRRVYFESQADPDQPDRILLSRSSINLQVGDQVSVTATVVDRFGNEIPDAQVTWSSADPSVATVTESAPAGTGSSGAS